WAPSSSSRLTSVSAPCLQPSSSSQRGTCLHEYISGYYRVSVYFLSKILCDLIMRTITSVIFSVVVYFLIATAMTMAISVDQSVVALANIFMTITFVFMMVRNAAVQKNECTGEQYLDYLGIKYSSWGLWENHVALTVMMVIFLLIAYLKLRYIKMFT
ncbi:hypothetical protein GOODEAATRI_006994, partial [Goodea atripinnis]